MTKTFMVFFTGDQGWTEIVCQDLNITEKHHQFIHQDSSGTVIKISEVDNTDIKGVWIR